MSNPRSPPVTYSVVGCFKRFAASCGTHSYTFRSACHGVYNFFFNMVFDLFQFVVTPVSILRHGGSVYTLAECFFFIGRHVILLHAVLLFSRWRIGFMILTYFHSHYSIKICFTSCMHESPLPFDDDDRTRRFD